MNAHIRPRQPGEPGSDEPGNDDSAIWGRKEEFGPGARIARLPSGQLVLRTLGTEHLAYRHDPVFHRELVTSGAREVIVEDDY